MKGWHIVVLLVLAEWGGIAMANEIAPRNLVADAIGGLLPLLAFGRLLDDLR